MSLEKTAKLSEHKKNFVMKVDDNVEQTFEEKVLTIS